MDEVDEPTMATDAVPVAMEVDNLPPKRLMITNMELENFKSYAGIKEIGPFHKCFSSVVGPNGSGKSNVIDAMLFVFGKRAKKLRLNKVSELIHKSSAVLDDPPTFARVSVYFQEIIDTDDNEEGYHIVPGSDCVVTRVARNDNSSTYKMNGRNCQFKDVAAYLSGKGIDLDNNRFLILQGEVEMISMMPPKGKTEQDEGLLEYLEDIIGSSKYVEETNLKAEQVEAFTVLRTEKLNRVKAVEKEKDALEAAKIEAEALLGKEREIRRKQNVLFQLHVASEERDLAKLEAKLAEVQERLQQEREQLSAANARVAEIEGGLVEQQRDYDKVHAELKKTKEEFAGYERRDIKIKEEIKHSAAQKKKLQKKIEAEVEKEQAAVAKGEAAVESIPGLETRIEELAKLKAEEDAKLEQIYDDMKGVTQQLRTQLESKSQELAPVQQEKAVFQNNLETAETEVLLLENATKRAKEKLAAAENELANLDENQQSKRSELEAAKEELVNSKARITEAEKEDQMLTEKEGKLVKKGHDLMARSEEAKAMLQSKGGGRNKAVDGILEAARKGGPLSKVGILGRLGDLGTIPEQYDVAVTTASGHLDAIVIQTAAGAQRCIEHLRKYNLGRANFVVLDKLKKGAHDRTVETPENAPRLFELITPITPAATPAIFYAVGQTLVAPDLETATRWAFDYGKRWRVVTVDGKVVDNSGTMSGGGNSVRRGGMKLTNAPKKSAADVQEDEEQTQDCQRLEDETKKVQQLIQECRSRRNSLAEEVRALKKRVKTLEIQLPKLDLEIEGYDTTRAELTKSIPGLRTQCQLSKKDAAKLAELTEVVDKCKNDMASCAELAAKLEAEVADLQKAILDAGGPKLRKQQAACEKVLKDLNSSEKELNSAKVGITSSEKAAAKARAAKESAEDELEKCRATLEEKKAERKSLEEDALKVMQAFEAVKALEAEKRQALEAVTEECEELRQSQSKVKVVEIELLGQVDSCEKQVTECKRKLDHWASAIENLRAKAAEDDDFDDSDDEEEDESKTSDGATEASDDCDEEILEDAEQPPKVKPTPKGVLPTYSAEALARFSKQEIQEDISVLESERNTIAKNANMGAIAEYRKKEADYLARVSELDAVTHDRDEVRKVYDDLRRKRLEMFMDGFGQITLKLKEMYQMITLGGDAELELVDSLDPFSEGIVFSVRPPKKSWKNISNLSGGEKTLSSLALVFALHHFKPTPLYVMDEIDAALDFKNVSIVANYIKERTKNAQFIIISLRNNMFELADRLVGIYKTNNCTKSVTIDPAAFGISGQQNGFGSAKPALGEKTNKFDSEMASEKDSSQQRVSFPTEATVEA